MAANTLMFTFKVNASDLKQKATVELLNGIGKVVFGETREEPVLVDLGGSRDFLLIFPGQRGSHASLRVYSHGLVTLDIQHYLEDLDLDKTRYPYNMTKVVGSRTFYACSDKKLQVSEEYIRSLENKLKNYLGDSAVELNALYSPVRRGQKIWPYTVTADERLVELDVDRVVYDHHSAYQHITILHSQNLGNLLFLDGDIMLGESDVAYTETIMAVDTVDYRDKDVLILGGGDGAILHELLKRQPRHVLMAEIDVAVIEACRTHMRSVCGASLDVLQGHNYKILIEDCVKVLCDTIAAGRMFDYVINDLTEYPVEKVQNSHHMFKVQTSYSYEN